MQSVILVWPPLKCKSNHLTPLIKISLWFPTVLVRILQKNRTDRSLDVGSHNYGGWKVPRSVVGKLKVQENQCALPIWVWRPVNQDIWRCKFESESQKAWDLRTSNSIWVRSPEKIYAPSPRNQAEEVLSYSWSTSLFVLFRLSPGSVRPIPIGRVICFTQPDSNVNLIQKRPHRNNNFWPNT